MASSPKLRYLVTSASSAKSTRKRIKAWSRSLLLDFPASPLAPRDDSEPLTTNVTCGPRRPTFFAKYAPPHALLENVPGLLAPSHGYFGTVIADLASLGYDAEWGCLGAYHTGALHKRNRLWVWCTKR
jgi:hypothetical protein